MAATLNISAGVLTYTGSGANNSLTVSVVSGAYTFADTGETITLGAGAVAAGWTGTGTNTAQGSDSSVSAISIDLGTGTNVCNIKSINDPLTFAPSGGTNTVNVCSNAPTNSGNLSLIAADITHTPSGGTTTWVIVDGSPTNAKTPTLTSTQITGLLGSAGAGNFNYTGTPTLTVNTTSSLHLATPWTISSTAATVTVKGGTATEAFNVGDVNGLDDITGVVTVNGGTTSRNAMTLDDTTTASAKTIGLGSGTVTGMAGATFSYDTSSTFTATTGIVFKGGPHGNSWTVGAGSSSSIPWSVQPGSGTDNVSVTQGCTGVFSNPLNGTTTWIFGVDGKNLTGTLTGGTGTDTLSLNGRTTGTNTLTITSNNSSGAAGTGAFASLGFSNINAFVSQSTGSTTMNVSALTGFTNDNAGTMTAGGNSFTYSGSWVITPYIGSTPAAPTGTAQVGSTLTASDPGAVGGGSITYAYQWKSAGSNVGSNQNTYVPVTGDTGNTITVTATPSNAGGAGAAATSAPTSAVLPAAPVADFTGTPLAGTASLSVTFTDSSTNTPTSWLWEKNSGSGWVNFAGTPTAQNPTESFAAGTWSVRMTATNAGGSDTKTRSDYLTATAPTNSRNTSSLLLLGAG